MATRLPAQFDFMKLFSKSRQEDAFLKIIRDRIFHFCWGRDRFTWGAQDFIISDGGVRRNIQRKPQRPPSSVGGSKKSNASRRFSTDDQGHNLLFVNKAVNAAFTRFIYDINTLEIDVAIHPVANATSRAANRMIMASIQNSPNFAKYSRMLDVVIRFPKPSEYLDGVVPDFNRVHLEQVVTLLSSYRVIESLRLIIVTSSGNRDRFEMSYVAFPFYELEFEGWVLEWLSGRTRKQVDNTFIQGLDAQYRQYRSAKRKGCLPPAIYPNAPKKNFASNDTQTLDIQKTKDSQTEKKDPAHKGRQVSPAQVPSLQAWATAAQEAKERNAQTRATASVTIQPRSHQNRGHQDSASVVQAKQSSLLIEGLEETTAANGHSNRLSEDQRDVALAATIEHNYRLIESQQRTDSVALTRQGNSQVGRMNNNTSVAPSGQSSDLNGGPEGRSSLTIRKKTFSNKIGDGPNGAGSDPESL